MGSSNDSDKPEMPENEVAAWILISMSNDEWDESVTLTAPPKRKAPEADEQAPEADEPKPNKPKKQKWKEVDLSAATPEMPAAMRERIVEMGGNEIRLVIQKQLYDTDLNKNHGRLSLPIKKLKFDFVTAEETVVLDQTVGKSKQGFDVMIVDPELRESSICLKKWKIGSNDVYCLMTRWNSFVKQNDLKSGDVVQLWSFRKDGADVANHIDNPHHLCFAITKPDIDLFQ